jgi:NTP pyrophosphatase (non-canonical NTP hydrolase)
MEPTSIRNLSLAGFQGLNSSIYLIQNDINYDAADMVSRMLNYSTQILKAVRKGKVDRVRYDLAMTFSWALALANKFHIALDDEMWRRFPGYCPYCTCVPCACSERNESRKILAAPLCERPATLRDYQVMFRMIYPKNTLEKSSAHLVEEVSEVSQAIEFFKGTHRRDLYAEIVIELVDVVTNICAVASCLDIDIACEMENQFAGGCTKCHETRCNCWYTTAKSVSIR